MGKPVMTKAQRKNHARIVFGSFAGLTGAILVAAFVAPFYGALDRPVTVVESGEARPPVIVGTGNGIVVEQFDYNEPDKNSPTAPDASTDHDGQNAPERESARPPLSDLGLATMPPPPELPAPVAPVDDGEPMQLLQRPVAIAAGKLESQGRIVDLQGIEAVPVDQTCQTADGESWPCGMQARTAFRQWLRSRAIMCRLPQNDSGSAVATQCSVGNEDPALWLVTNGWAKAAVGDAYQETGEKAAAAKLGLYGEKPETNFPEFNNNLSLPTDIAPQTLDQPVTPLPLNGDFPPAPQN